MGNALQPGSTFAGRYRIVQLIGTGGMGSVYEAEDELSGDVLALKVISSSALAEDFRQELLIGRKLTHTNVVRIYDIGIEGATLFISMELVDGIDLAVLLKQKRRLHGDEFLSLFQQLWVALDYVHGHQILHRDIKLRNLMLTSDGILKLMDFGIAHEIGNERTTSNQSGTPGYLAPELLGGGEPNPQSDIFSAGVVCWHLLAGEKPGEEAAPLDYRNAGIPAALARLIERCIDADPARRPPSAAAVLKETATILKGALPAMNTNRTLSEFISQDPAATDAVLPQLATIARAAAGLPAEHTAISPHSIRLAADGSVTIDSAAGEAKYSAPELFQENAGDDAKTAPAARVYILGFIFYELLVGRRKFDEQLREVLKSGDDLAWFEWHGNTQRSLQPVHELVPACPEAVSAVIAQMVEKDPHKRIPNVLDAAARLEDIGSGFESTIVRAVPRVRRQFWTAGRVLFVSTGVFVALLYFSWRQWPQLWAEVMAAFTRRADAADSPAPSDSATSLKPSPIEQPVPEPAPPPVPVPVHDPAPVPDPAPPSNIDTPTGPMVLIPEGEFLMGSDSGRKSARFAYENEAPAHRVSVAPFYMDLTEVPNGAYLQFCRSTQRACPKNPPWDSQYFERFDYPVLNVSWDEAKAFCDWAGKELPSEAQWERAARGNEQFTYPWGNDRTPNKANLKTGDDYTYAAPVGSFPADRSPFGVLDTAGNLPEWTADDYALYPGNPTPLPNEEKGQKVIRGGGFMTEIEVARATNRASAMPALRSNSALQVGFRCAADPKALVLKRSADERH